MAFYKCPRVVQSVVTEGIFGAEWDGSSSTAWTRTDNAANFPDPNPAVNNGTGSSPFDDIMPWSGMQRVEDSAAGTLVSIPKFWYKWTKTGSALKLQIANVPQEGFHVSPAHMDRGDGAGERDVVYVGAYHCAGSTYKSTTRTTPQGNTYITGFRTNIHNLGSNIWQWDYATFWTIAMLYLVEYADWDSQEKIGYGCSDAGYVELTGLCDSMIYHTGTNAISRSTYGHTRYRYIEDLWGNVHTFFDGIYFSSSKAYCIKNPANFAQSGGTDTGLSKLSSSGEITAWNISNVSGFEYVLFPASIMSNASYSSYISDHYEKAVSNASILISSSYYEQDKKAGLFALLHGTAAVTGGHQFGARLMKLP